MTFAETTTAAAPSVGPFYVAAAVIAALAALAGVWIGGRRESKAWKRDQTLDATSGLIARTEEYVDAENLRLDGVLAALSRVRLLGGDGLTEAAGVLYKTMLPLAELHRAARKQGRTDAMTLAEEATVQAYVAARRDFVRAARAELRIRKLITRRKT